MAAPRLSNRREALDALAESETRYVKSLRATVNCYMVPLRDARLLALPEVDVIFRSMPPIRDVHGKLSQVMKAASEEDNIAEGVAAVATEFTRAREALLELYTPFARGHGEAMRVLRAASQRPDVSRALQLVISQDERVRGRSLEDLLVVPLEHLAELRDICSTLAALCSPTDRGVSYLTEAAETFTTLLREAAVGGWAPLSPAAPAAAAAAAAAAPVVGSALTGEPASASAPSASADSGASVGAGGGGAGGVHASILAANLPPGAMSALLASTGGAAAAGAAAAAGGAGSAANAAASAAAGSSDALASNPGAGAAAFPLPPSTLSADLQKHAVTTEAVLAAQAEADEAARRLEELQREVAMKDAELELAHKEVARAEAEAKTRGQQGIAAEAAGAAYAGSSSGPVDEALRRLANEERELFGRMAHTEQRAVFEAFLQRKRELEEEEARLAASLGEHEETLAQIRARLANPPESVLPSDAAKASLYIAWKKALADREELLRAARRRKHDVLRDMRAKFETQIVLLEMERRSAVEGLKEAVTTEKSKVEAYKRDLSALEESIETARGAMKKFRQEFEQLRVALLIDRMAKSSQVANLADRRARLAKEAEQFTEAVEAARARVAAEESAKWEARLVAEREAGEKRVAEERKLIEQKIEKVRAALAERYEAGFRPLLREAEQRHVEELQRVVALQRELESKEAELRSAHEAARAVSAAVTLSGEGGSALADDGSAAAAVDPVTGDPVPEWKLREFEDLKGAVAGLWEQLDVPAEDVTAFLSEADLMAPYSPQVLDMYQEMFRRLSGAVTAVTNGSMGEQGGHGYGGHAHPTAPFAPSASLQQPQMAAAAAGYGYDAEPASLSSSSGLPTAVRAVSPTAARTPQVPGAGAAGARGRPASGGPAGYRQTGIGSSRATDDAQHFLQRQRVLPPSLGGPGARSSAASSSTGRATSPSGGRR